MNKQQRKQKNKQSRKNKSLI